MPKLTQLVTVPRTLVRRLRYTGWQVRCDVCRQSSRDFATSNGRLRAKCPKCGALERHRALAPYLRMTLTGGLEVLHFAPEASIARVLVDEIRVDYTAADLDPHGKYIAPQVEVIAADITAQPFEDERFDAIIVSHVLEHIPDDRLAMSELFRVLRPGGLLIAQHPWQPWRAETDEDPSITDPAERRRRFGQEDHVRWYGRDYFERLEEAGFDVTILRIGATPGSNIAECRKPLRSARSSSAVAAATDERSGYA